MQWIFRVTVSILLLFIVAGQGIAQKDSTLSQKITKEFCDEFSKKEFTLYKDAEMELGLIILPIINKYSKEIEKEWGLSATNLDDYEKIGEKIGMEAALTCPQFMEFIANNMDAIGLDEEDIKSLGGKLTAVEEQQFTCFIIKTTSGKEEKLWWFGYFEGADSFVEKKENFMNKEVMAAYVEMEVYDPRLNDYRYIKVIKKLSKE